MRKEDMNGRSDSPLDASQPQPEAVGEMPADKPTPAPVEAPAEPKKSKNSGFQTLIVRIGTYLLFLALGALAVTLALYLPTSSNLKVAQAEVERLSEIEAQYAELQVDFAKVQQQKDVYNTISDTSVLQAALLERDMTKVNQQLRYVEDDLNALSIPEIPEVLQRLQSQFLKVKTNASGNPDQALKELGEFYVDLLNLADKLN